MKKKRRLLWLILLILISSALSFCAINDQRTQRKIEAFEENAITQFPTIQQELEACAEIVVPALIEINAYNVGKYGEGRKSPPVTPGIYAAYRDQYSPELQEALETIWRFGVITLSLFERTGELGFELKLEPNNPHFFSYYYIYNPDAPNASWSGKDDSYSTILADNWYFYSKPRGYPH